MKIDDTENSLYRPEQESYVLYDQKLEYNRTQVLESYTTVSLNLWL